MNIGDKVRFLNQTGGGIIKGFTNKGWAIVEDEEGFEIPMPLKECVVVEVNPANVKKGPEGTHLLFSFLPDKSSLICTFANECEYNLLLTITSIQHNQEKNLFAGEIYPFEVKKLFSLSKGDLNDTLKKLSIKGISFQKLGSTYNPKPIIDTTFSLNPLNFLKSELFKDNQFITSKAIIYEINPAEEDQFADIKEKDIKVALKEKFSPSSKNLQHSKPSKNTPGILEIDLHAHELLDTTAGMANADILLYQLDKFNEIMHSNLKNKGTKIVFIHGKGDGVLRNAVLKELRTKYPSCIAQDASFREYGFGATMVTIK